MIYPLENFVFGRRRHVARLDFFWHDGVDEENNSQGASRFRD